MKFIQMSDASHEALLALLDRVEGKTPLFVVAEIAIRSARSKEPAGWPPHLAPPACKDPSLGDLATQALGRVLPPTVVTHLATCAACRLQCALYSELDGHALPPSGALRDRLRATARDRFSPQG